jgi:KDO2-lipid IV(A) lauroyltransferase
MLGVVLYIIFPYRKDVARSNLQQAFPDFSPLERRNILRRAYQHFAVIMVDFFRIPLLTEPKLASIIDFDETYLREATGMQQGALIMSAHVGNWELLISMLAKSGYPLVPIVMPQRGPGGTYIKSVRDSMGCEYISKKSSTRTMLRLLKEGKFLGLAGDQDGRKGGVWVTFFNHLSSRPRGGAVFSIQTGAPLLAAWCVLQPDNRYRISFTPIPADNLPPDKESAVLELTQRYILAVEEIVRKYPEQYFWFHRMWKTKPKN